MTATVLPYLQEIESELAAQEESLAAQLAIQMGLPNCQNSISSDAASTLLSISVESEINKLPKHSLCFGRATTKRKQSSYSKYAHAVCR